MSYEALNCKWSWTKILHFLLAISELKILNVRDRRTTFILNKICMHNILILMDKFHFESRHKSSNVDFCILFFRNILKY